MGAGTLLTIYTAQRTDSDVYIPPLLLGGPRGRYPLEGEARSHELGGRNDFRIIGPEEVEGRRRNAAGHEEVEGR